MAGLFISKRRRREAGEALRQRLENTSTLVVDKNLVAALGVGRRILQRIIYEMVRHERLFMLTDDEGRTILMSNAEFNRCMLRRVGKQDNAFSRLALDGAVTVSSPSLPDSTLLDHAPDGEAFPGRTLGGARRGDFWDGSAAALDSNMGGFANAETFAGLTPLRMDAGSELPVNRQIPPVRRREPWTMAEETEKDTE